jgi:hypothetical protein
MRDPRRFFSGTVAKLLAILHEDWMGRAGAKFRAVARVVSEFAEEHDATPRQVADDAMNLGRRKLEGLASQEHAEALLKYAEAEKVQIENEWIKRTDTRQARSRKELAEIEHAELENEVMRVKLLDARLELIAKLQKLNVIFTYDETTNTIIFASAGETMRWEDLEGRIKSISDAAQGLPIPTEKPNEQ